jgi:hypothetical protein
MKVWLAAIAVLMSVSACSGTTDTTDPDFVTEDLLALNMTMCINALVEQINASHAGTKTEHYFDSQSGQPNLGPWGMEKHTHDLEPFIPPNRQHPMSYPTVTKPTDCYLTALMVSQPEEP